MVKKLFFFFLFSLLPSVHLSAWSAPVVIETTENYIYSPKVAINATGTAVAVWVEGSYTDQNLRYSFYNGITWTVPGNVVAGGTMIRNISLGINSLGSALVLWESTSEEDTSEIFYSILDDLLNWSLPAILPFESPQSATAALNLLADGTGYMIWTDRESDTIQAISVDLGLGTGVLEAVSSPGESPLFSAIASNGINSFIVSWNDQVSNELLWSENTGGGWTTPELVGTHPSSREISIVQSILGFSLITWTDPFHNIYGSYRPAGMAWSPPTQLSTTTQSIHPRVAVSSTNNGVAIWENSALGSIESVSFSSGGNTWDLPITTLSVDEANHSAQLALDTAGDGWAVWSSALGDVVLAARYLDASGWQLPAQEISLGLDNSQPSFVLSPTGIALAVWIQRDGTDNTIVFSRDDG